MLQTQEDGSLLEPVVGCPCPLLRVYVFVLFLLDFFFSLTLTNIFSHLFSFSDLYLFIDIFDYLLFDFFLMNWLVKGEKFELLPFSAL